MFRIYYTEIHRGSIEILREGKEVSIVTKPD
jgi:hypothetical protein